MVLWWIGNAILLLVVLPVVIFLLNRVLAAVERIRAATDDILAGGVELVGELAVVPDGLATTDAVVSQVSAGAARAPSPSSSAEGRIAMPAAAWATIVISALIIAITAVGLLRVIFHLRAIRKTLAATTGGVRAVAQLTSTVPGRLTSVNASLKPVRDFCETV
jgi:hypothetical protein